MEITSSLVLTLQFNGERESQTSADTTSEPEPRSDVGLWSCCRSLMRVSDQRYVACVESFSQQGGLQNEKNAAVTSVQHYCCHGYWEADFHRKRKKRRRKEVWRLVDRNEASEQERRGPNCLTCPTSVQLPAKMSSRSDTKSASQIGFLTTKLKDKFHQQRGRRSEPIKHTPTERVKPPDLNLTRNQSAGVLVDRERAVVSSLQYFKALVDRLGLDRPGGDKLVLDQSMVGGLLGGASSRILEAVQILVQLEPHLLNSKTVSACLTRLYHSVAGLIRWADQVMLRGVSQDNEDSSESVTTVIRGVLNGAKELVRLVAERREGSAPLSPLQSHKKGTSTCSGPSDKDKGMKTETQKEEHQKLAPPKPPMPLPELLPQVTSSQGPTSSPPALPPKKRQTPSVPVTTHCRVAIVTPMIREPKEDTQVEQVCTRVLPQQELNFSRLVPALMCHRAVYYKDWW
ncbi:hypothetical protein AMECASPLE_025210 [Ameca splendens]|uniref:Uncharacterized protein n=1 Tax=Ameca splendens TaxID=208324 RepID=A0ABV0Z2V7_9TELE